MGVLGRVVWTPWGVAPLWLLVLVAVLVVVASVLVARVGAGLARMVRRVRLLPACMVAVARLRADPAALMGDCDLVSLRRTWSGHSVSWPRVWCSPSEANLRGGRLVNELWPDELPLPVERRGACWRMRSRRL